MKRCPSCRTEKPLEEFHADKRRADGKTSSCKVCAGARSKKRHAEKREEILAKRRQHYRENTADYAEAHRQWKADNRDKVNELNRRWAENNPDKVNESRRKWKKANPDKVNESARRCYQANPEKMRDRARNYREENPDKVKEMNRRWTCENPHKANAKTAKRRADKLQRSSLLRPGDQDKIKAIYAEAKRLTEETGIVHHVDHIVPLRGETCSGLHVPCNLRVVPAQLNLSKGAKIDYELVPNAFRLEEFS